jgi:tripeptide aminopeptidase
MNSNTFTVVERFLRYVQIDTQSDPHSVSNPSTEKQKDLSRLLVKELQDMGVTDVHTDDYGYVYATIPSNIDRSFPVICFCSHVDTAPDCSGTNVKPLLHKNYQGQDIVLPDDTSQIISIKNHPYLKKQMGKDIITASGLTLLGADDKSGVAIIMDMAHYLLQHPEIPHGTIKILFTPDEEVGRGTDHVDLNQLGADFAYTLDGGELGTYEDETFSADGCTLHFYGVSAHPGYAKGKMVNALKLAGTLLQQLLNTEWCPEATVGKQGFVHPVHIEGTAEKASIEFIIRDFDTSQLAVYESRLIQMAEAIVSKYPGAKIEAVIREQYRNMKEIIDQHPQMEINAREAYAKAGIPFIKEPIRGGTDGSRLSFMGLPCANIFTGMQGIHSRQEWVSVYDMEKSVEVLVNLVQVWAK